jgi:predicted  nucleic acid-binding Zn-ribbon protein
MLGLEKVLDLQIHYNKLESLKKEQDKIENDQEISRLERVYISDQKNIERVMIESKENEKEIKTSTRELEEYAEKFKKVETTVYNGEITDIKQLEYLNKEKTYLSDLIDSLENKIIAYLEKNDKFETNIKQWQSEIANKEKKIITLEKQMKKSLSNIKKEIEKNEVYINKISQGIEAKLLEQFLSIKDRKKDSGIATVVDGVCSECNIMIRSAQVGRIKLGKEVYTCESCGRILVFLEPVEPKED